MYRVVVLMLMLIKNIDLGTFFKKLKKKFKKFNLGFFGFLINFVVFIIF